MNKKKKILKGNVKRLLDHYHKILYEGLYNTEYDYGNINKSCVVLKFNVNDDKTFICLEEHNETIDKFGFFENTNVPMFSSPFSITTLLSLGHSLKAERPISVIEDGRVTSSMKIDP